MPTDTTDYKLENPRTTVNLVKAIIRTCIYNRIVEKERLLNTIRFQPDLKSDCKQTKKPLNFRLYRQFYLR